MKSYLLPLAAALGAVGTFALMLTTQAAPSCCTHPEAMQQVQKMEYQSRLREWSQGLGVDLPGAGTTIAKAEIGSTTAARPERAADRVNAGKQADRGARHTHDDRHDGAKDRVHDDDEDKGNS